jgi:cysteine synthase A
LVTLICDGGERYASSYYNDDWLASEGLDLAPFERTLASFLETGQFSLLAEC